MKKSKAEHFEFHLYNEDNRSLNKRTGEIKLSEKVSFGKDTANTKYIIVGISEDIGPQMNGGFAGSNQGFQSVVQSIQNAQSNPYLSGTDVGILGEFKQTADFTSVETCKNWVEELDEFILEILNEFVNKDQILIVIGGGHNNALPILRHLNYVNSSKVQSVNIDPHADCRSTEYRHSGNPFSFAFQEGLLESYSVFGLHESYNNSFIFDFLEKNSCSYNTFEDYVDSPENWWINIKNTLRSLQANIPLALDIDLDSIAFCPSSALTPSGFTIEEIRKMIRLIAANHSPQSLHLPEGAPKSETELRLYGKMISYFVLDFIKTSKAK